MALSAKVTQQAQELKDKRLTLSKKLLDRIKERRLGKLLGAGQGGRNSKLEYKDGYCVYMGTHAWKLDPLEDGKSLNTQWKGQDYNWCPKHKAWVQHNPAQCDFDPKKRKHDGESVQETNKKRNEGDNGGEVARIMQALLSEINAEE